MERLEIATRLMAAFIGRQDLFDETTAEATMNAAFRTADAMITRDAELTREQQLKDLQEAFPEGCYINWPRHFGRKTPRDPSQLGPVYPKVVGHKLPNTVFATYGACDDDLIREFEPGGLRRIEL